MMRDNREEQSMSNTLQYAIKRPLQLAHQSFARGLANRIDAHKPIKATIVCNLIFGQHQQTSNVIQNEYVPNVISDAPPSAQSQHKHPSASVTKTQHGRASVVVNKTKQQNKPIVTTSFNHFGQTSYSYRPANLTDQNRMTIVMNNRSITLLAFLMIVHSVLNNCTTMVNALVSLSNDENSHSINPNTNYNTSNNLTSIDLTSANNNAHSSYKNLLADSIIAAGILYPTTPSLTTLSTVSMGSQLPDIDKSTVNGSNLNGHLNFNNNLNSSNRHQISPHQYSSSLESFQQFPQQLPNSMADLSSVLHQQHTSTSRSQQNSVMPSTASHQPSPVSSVSLPSSYLSTKMTTPSLNALYHSPIPGLLGIAGGGGITGNGVGGHHEAQASTSDHKHSNNDPCYNGFLTFELTTGFIYTPSSAETLAMLPGTLQLTECLGYCLKNSSCQAVNFEMGLCVLLSSSAQQNPAGLLSSQFPVFTIYAEKLCLLPGDSQANRQKRRCPRAWTFERVAGYEMKTRPRRRLSLISKEHCMQACLLESEFDCRSANWYRNIHECTLSDQDRHSVTQRGPNDNIIKSSLIEHYGPALAPNLMYSVSHQSELSTKQQQVDKNRRMLIQRNNNNNSSTTNQIFNIDSGTVNSAEVYDNDPQLPGSNRLFVGQHHHQLQQLSQQQQQRQFMAQQQFSAPAYAMVDYLENNCIYEPNKLCEFRKLQNRILKTVDSIYQDIQTLDECKQKCINAPYRCYSFDFGDTANHVCRTSHLDQSSLTTVQEPYLEVMGAITYELASCYNVSITCKAREMVAKVKTSKIFNGKIYVKSKPKTCVNDIENSLEFEIYMRYNDRDCDVKASSNASQGVFSNDIVIQHHDRIVTTQDVGLSIHCQYDLSNKSVTNNVNLAIDGLDDLMESKNDPNELFGQGATHSSNKPMISTSLATTMVRSPNITMSITNIHGLPIATATVGDRLALMFEIKDKSSPFGIFVREIVAVDGRGNQRQVVNNNHLGYHKSTTDWNDEPRNAAFSAQSSQSVLLVDSLGCPTDSNIMGPLAKLDSIGHTILAPFDAFKFPTSDMVLFKASVTTCVSECEPVYCGLQPTSSIPPNGNSYSTGNLPHSPALSAGTSTATASEVGDHHHLPSTTTLYTFTTPFASSPLPALNNLALTRSNSSQTFSHLQQQSAVNHQQQYPPVVSGRTSTGQVDTMTTPALLSTSASPLRNQQQFKNNDSPVGMVSSQQSIKPQQHLLNNINRSMNQAFNQPLLGHSQSIDEPKGDRAADLDDLINQEASSIEGDMQQSNQFVYSSTTPSKTLKDDTTSPASHLHLNDAAQLFDAHEFNSFPSVDVSKTDSTTISAANKFNVPTSGVGKYVSLPAAQLYQQQLQGSTVKSYGKKRRRRRKRRRRDLQHSDNHIEQQWSSESKPTKITTKDFLFSMNLGGTKFHQLRANIVDVDQIKDILARRRSQIRHGRFINGVNNGDGGDHRNKQKPIYEMDELVVQSIRIVDKIQFKDDMLSPQSSNSTVGRAGKYDQSTSDNQLRRTTSGIKHHLKDLKSSRNMIKHNQRQRSNDDSFSPLMGTGDGSGEIMVNSDERTTRISSTNAGVLSLIIGTVSFVFVQIFLVLLCFVNWNKRQTRTMSPSSSIL